MAHLLNPSLCADEKKSERLEARITSEKKNLLKRAAELSHSSFSDFIIHTLMEKADKIIRNHNVLKLSDADSKRFTENLLSPPEASSKLKQAINNYKKNQID